MSTDKKLFFALICSVLAANVFGQAARSPFTSFGIGEPYGNALINTQGMAGVGVSQPQYWYLNNQNPALLVYNNYTVFQAGILYESRTLRRDTATQKNVGGNMNYLVTAFPVKLTKWTTSLGLMPYTTVKYKYTYIDNIQNSTDQVVVTDEGSGGLTQLYWANGVRLNKDFAIGLKAAYIFSSIKTTYSNRLLNSSQPINYDATLEDKSYVKDLAFSGGLSFSRDSLFSGKRYRFSAGLVYNFKANLNTLERTELYRSTASSGPLERDTIYSAKSSILIPPAITGGISLSRGSKWTLATEFSYQDWTTFKAANNENDALGKAWRIAVGGELTPDLLSEKFLNRMTYRSGLSMEQYPYLANNNIVKDVGINFGFSMPAGRSSVDVAFKYGKRGNKKDNIFEENYFKIYFGITFNDQWFIKRKFD